MKKLLTPALALSARALPLLACLLFSSHAQTISVGEALDAPSFSWQMPAPGGWYPWIIDTNNFTFGGSSLRAEVHDFSDAPGFSTSLVGPGTLNFSYRLSGSGNSALGQNAARLVIFSGAWDYLFWSDQDTNWTTATVFLPAGTNTLLWAFELEWMPAPPVTSWVDHVEFLPGGTPAFVDIQPRSLTFVSGGSGTLQAFAGGTPPLAYQWRCNGTNLAGVTSSWVSVSSSVPGQTNLYTCVVSNSYGMAVSSGSSIYTLGSPSDPWIEFTYVPYIGVADYVHLLIGNVSGYSNYVIAAYINAWTGWWNKPYWDAPLTPINNDGTAEFWYVTGGVDITASSMMVFLLRQGATPPQMSGQCCFPPELFTSAVAVASVSRVPGVPSTTVRLRPDGVLMVGLRGSLPGHRFAIQRSSGLVAQPWVSLLGTTNFYDTAREFEYHPLDGERAAFFRGIEVP